MSRKSAAKPILKQGVDQAPSSPGQPIASSPKTIKEVMDRHKGWFDYASCCLGVSAWFVAIGYVAVMNWRLRMDTLDFVFWITNVSLLPAFAYGIFLIVVLYRVTFEAIPMTNKWVTGNILRDRIIGFLMIHWVIWGLPAFILTLITYFVWVTLGGYSKP